MMAELFYFNLRKVELCWLLILGYSTVKAVSEAKRLRSPALKSVRMQTNSKMRRNACAVRECFSL
jgi:hypothetical protein